jgi:hypothetical protein
MGCNEGVANRRDLLDAARGRKIARQAIERLRPALPRHGFNCFKSCSRGQFADDQRDNEHHAKRDKILGVLDSA